VETNVKAIELKDLWRRYKSSGDERARERLVVAFSPLVKYVAGRMASGLPAHVDEADLISYGLVGLISAISRFEPEREIKFETYAITRIKGAIIDELRSQDWVPRSVRARARAIEKANAKLEHKLQRAPSDEEMSLELEMSVEDFHAALLQISNSTVAALDELWTVSDASGDQVSLLDTLQDPDAADPVPAAHQGRPASARAPHRRGPLARRGAERRAISLIASAAREPQVHRHQHARRLVRRLWPHALARRERGRVPARRIAPHGLRPVHVAGHARGLDPRGGRRRPARP